MIYEYRFAFTAANITQNPSLAFPKSPCYSPLVIGFSPGVDGATREMVSKRKLKTATDSRGATHCLPAIIAPKATAATKNNQNTPICKSALVIPGPPTPSASPRVPPMLDSSVP
jgi:hypothetical protein